MSAGAKPVKVGIDLVEVEKVRKVFEGRRSLQETTFTAQELRDLLTYPDPYIHLAVCFAAKEALFKALGTGLSGEMDWRDVEVWEEAFGKPLLRLWGQTSRLVRQMGIVEYALAVSHTRDYAVALVVVIHGVAQATLSES